VAYRKRKCYLSLEDDEMQKHGKVVTGSNKNAGRRLIRNKDGTTTLVIRQGKRRDFGSLDAARPQTEFRRYNSGKKTGDKR
jgi:hypothetical protein